MSEQTFNRLQWQLDSKGFCMIVIRENDEAEFDRLTDKYEKKFPGAKVVAKPAPTSNGTPKVCDKHGVELEWSQYPSKKTGKKYLFHKDEEGNYCFGH